MKLTRAILASLTFAGSVWIASWYWHEAMTFDSDQETKRIAEAAKYDLEIAKLETRQTELMVFLQTRYDYPIDKWGCPVPELYEMVKQKNGKSKKVKIC